jgi:hypothetical protein
VERVNTLSQFDAEVTKAYKRDRFLMKRLDGLLDVKAKWNKCLGYSKYGTTRTTSAAAKAQGGRQEEPMCMHFFRSKQPGSNGVTLMQYKYRESDLYWMPYSCEGIPVLSDHAKSLGAALFDSPEVAQPKDWPDKDKIYRHLMDHSKLSEGEKGEWKSFFDNIPSAAADIPVAKRFKWLLPDLALKCKAARGGAAAVSERVGESSRPAKPDERVVYSGFTEADLRKAEKQRADNFAREEHALQERQRSEQLASRGHQHRQLEEESADDSQSASDSDISSESSRSGTSSEVDNPPSPKQHGDLQGARGKRSMQAKAQTRPRASASVRHSKAAPPKPKLTTTTATTPKKRNADQTMSCPTLPMGDSGVIEIGDVLMFSPDDQSREKDRLNNYHLGVCLGKVLDINPRSRAVHVWWYHGTDWTRRARWIEWREPVSKKPYTDWVEADSFLVDSFGTIAKVKFEKGSNKGYGVFAICNQSLKTIKDVLATNNEDDL